MPGISISRLGIPFRRGGGGVIQSILSNFKNYLFPEGVNKTFSDGDTLTVAEGAVLGTYKVVDTGAGVISMVSRFLKIIGDRANWDTTYIYGDSFLRAAGVTHVWSAMFFGNLNRVVMGLCKSDLSSMYTGVLSAETYCDLTYARGTGVFGGGMWLWTRRNYYGQMDYIFVVGGFNISQEPYMGVGDPADYSYGGYIFTRGANYPQVRLMGIGTVQSETVMRPFASIYEDRSDVKIYRHMFLKTVNPLPQPYLFKAESDASVVETDGETFTMFALLSIPATSGSINIKVLLDDEGLPLNYIDIQCDRVPSNVQFTVNQYVGGIPTLYIVKAFAYTADYGFAVWCEQGLMMITYKGGYLDPTKLEIDPALIGNSKILVTNNGTSRINKLMLYKTGFEDNCFNTYLPKSPYNEGISPPGYGLPAEIRKGWHFDIGHLCMHTSNSQSGATVELRNGRSTIRVRYRQLNKQYYIKELDFAVDLPYAYTGTDQDIFIGSDIHWGTDEDGEGYGNNAKEILSKILFPELITLGIDTLFLLGDISHDTNFYDDIDACFATYAPALTWYPIPGNHDPISDFNTHYGYVYKTLTIGNIVFIMVGDNYPYNWDAARINYLHNQLVANQDKNCIIMTHRPRYMTLRKSDYDWQAPEGDIETAVAGLKFVAWFSGHSHGWSDVKDDDNSSFLFLGNAF